jgi:hypothetical protein
MVVQCPSCLTKFSVDASLFAKFSNPRFHCTRCGHYFASNSSVPTHASSSGSSSKHGSLAKVRRSGSAADEAEQLELLPKAPQKGAAPKKHRRVERSGEHTPAPASDEDISVTAQWNDDQGQIQYEADLGQIHAVEAEVVAPSPSRSFAAGIASRIAAAAQAPTPLAQGALIRKTSEAFEYKEYRDRQRPLDPSSESLRDSGIELFEPQNPFVEPVSNERQAHADPVERKFGPSAGVINEGSGKATEDHLPVAEWNTPEFDCGTTEYISPFQTPFQSIASPYSEDESSPAPSLGESSFGGLGTQGEQLLSTGYLNPEIENSRFVADAPPSSASASASIGDSYHFGSTVDSAAETISNNGAVTRFNDLVSESESVHSPSNPGGYSASSLADQNHSSDAEADWALEPTATSGTGNWSSQPWTSSTHAGASQSTGHANESAYDKPGVYDRSAEQIDRSQYAARNDVGYGSAAIESFQRIAASAVAGAKARTTGRQFSPLLVSPVLAAAGKSALSVSVPIVALTIFLRLSGFFGGYGGIGSSGQAPLRFLTSIGESSLPHAAPLGMELTDIRPEVVSLDNGEEVMQITGNVVNTTRRKISEAIIEAKTFSNTVEPLEMVEVNFSNGLTNAARLGALGAPSLLELQTHQGIKEARLNPNERAPFKLVIPTTAGKAAWYSARIARVRYEDS